MKQNKITVYKASAGSGKTFTLAASYIELLLNSDDASAFRHTLAVTFTNKATAEMKERILVKSGSMNGIRCYSGYIIPTEGCKEDSIIFSILVNNSTAPTWRLRPLLDKIMGTLAECN